MPKLIPSGKFLEDIEAFKSQKEIIKKIAKALAFLEENPHHPGLNLERIVNDPKAWSVRVDRYYRISFDLEKFLPSGAPDWSGSVVLLRVLSHDDLYKRPRQGWV
jgi:mRNA-degrading endonuclease RelE of RelBE toxin-antitoxin system